MIPGSRRKKPQTPSFPLEKAKALWAKFPIEARDISFQKFYQELCSLNDPEQMRKDLDCIQVTRAREHSNRLMVEKALQNANQ